MCYWQILYVLIKNDREVKIIMLFIAIYLIKILTCTVVLKLLSFRAHIPSWRCFQHARI